ncbi:MAG: HEPN domain-containing protein [Bacteroidota bacterium]|nr:HEPN domain-containing protein [Bacteroidota bacterium]
MDKQDYIDYWVKTSECDLSSMQTIFQAGKYDWSLFIGHLALEKILKALWIKDNERNFPPKSHNLLKLAEETSYKPDEGKKILLVRITSFQLESRYPDYKLDFYNKCTKEFTEENIINITELHKCIMEMI